MRKEKFLAWKKANKITIQVIALVLAILCPFVLFGALNAGLSLLAGFAFVGVTLAMAFVAGLT